MLQNYRGTMFQSRGTRQLFIDQGEIIKSEIVYSASAEIACNSTDRYSGRMYGYILTWSITSYW